MATVNKLRDPGALHLKSIEGTGTGKRPLTIADFPASASKGDRVAICYLPRNSVVVSTAVVNTTAWNGTGAEILIGTGSDDNALIATGDFTPAIGLNTSTNSVDGGTDGQIIYATLQFTAKPTAGSSHIVIAYMRYGDTRDSGGKLGNTGDITLIEPTLVKAT